MHSTLNTRPDSLELAPLGLDELESCVPFGQKFHAEMGLPGEFRPDVFLKNWTAFLTAYRAIIWTLRKNGELVGGLGGMMVPDLLDGRQCAHEFFWFVDKAHRTGTGAIRLLNRFESWAKEQGAVEVRMVHLVGNHDDQLKRIYEKRGYRCIELNYCKPL